MKKSNHHNQGFMLMELLVYFCIAMMTVLLVVEWAAALQLRMKDNAKRTIIMGQLYAAHDRLRYDLRQAPADKRLWKKYIPNNYVWVGFSCDIGWELTEDGKLIRSEGNYEQTTDTWSERTKSLIVTQIDHCSITQTDDPNNPSMIHSLHVDLAFKEGAQLYTVSYDNTLRNGIT